MTTIVMKERINGYGENKDIAKEIRQNIILPALKRSEDIIIDFDGITGVTQSFIHALLADPIRQYPDEVFDRITFKNCNDMVRVIVETVEEYMQDSM